MVGAGDAVLIVGAGFGGLAAAVDLASKGRRVHVLERAHVVGGKARAISVGGTFVDAGPTVLTMRWVFDELFASAGRELASYATLRPAEVIARHAWPDGSRLDLFADKARTVDAIAAFAGAAEAKRYVAFARDAETIWRVAKGPFVLSQRPTLADVVKQTGLLGLTALSKIDGHRTMARALNAAFRDKRLVQLFGRYATYCGGSPFEAPATLNLISYVESEGVFTVDGGVSALAQGLARRAAELGVTFSLGADVREILVRDGVARGVRLASGEELRGRAVVVNADVSALAGLSAARAAAPTKPADRSLSAFTLAIVGSARGLPLAHHTVLFSEDSAREFQELLGDGRAPEKPTVYVCAQDRAGSLLEDAHEGARARPEAGAEAALPDANERFLLVANAPATGDNPARWDEQEITRCERAALSTLRACGIDLRAATMRATSPVDFERAFPATGGALYGPRPRGAMSAFARSGARTKIERLYLAGGSVHPGAGVPMAALSGRLAAVTVEADLRSTERSSRAAINGTTSTV